VSDAGTRDTRAEETPAQQTAGTAEQTGQGLLARAVARITEESSGQAEPAEQTPPPDPNKHRHRPGEQKPELSNASIHEGRSVIGVDVGTHTLKIVHLQTSGTGIRLLDAEAAVLPPASDPDRTHEVERLVEEFVGRARPRVKAACCALGDDASNTLCCSMPKMPEKDLAEALRWKLAEDGKINTEGATVGYYVPDRNQRGSKLEVVAAAADPHIGGMGRLFSHDHPRLSAVVSQPISAENVVMAAYHAQERGAVALLDIGAAASRLSVVGPAGLEFTRNIPVGGDSITTALSGTISIEGGSVDVSRQAAAELKKNYAIGQADPLQVNGQTVPAARILAAMRPVLERLATEITRSLQFYAQGPGHAGVDGLLVCGGGAGMGGLAEYLAREVRVPTSVLDPWRMLGFEVPPALAAEPNLFVAATGAAIHDRSRINLLPAHIRARRVIMAVRLGSIITTAALLFVLIGLSVAAKSQQAKLQRILELKQESVRPLEEHAARVEKADGYKAELRRRQKLLRSLGVGRPMHAGILKELSNIMPEGTYLRRMSFARPDAVRKMLLTVDVYSMPSAGSIQLKQRLVNALEESPFFVNVSFAPGPHGNSKQPRPPDETLTLTCQVLGFPGD
jgi:type IV pilus assembly protein PilM